MCNCWSPRIVRRNCERTNHITFVGDRNTCLHVHFNAVTGSNERPNSRRCGWREDQRVAWTYYVEGSWGAAPTVMGNMLYIGDNNGVVHAINAVSGKCCWKLGVAPANTRSRKLFSRAAVSDRRVYLGAADGTLYALDRASGARMWQHDCGDWIRSQPHCAGGVVCAATLDGKVIAVTDEGNACQALWSAELGRHPIYADLAGDHEGVIATTSDFQTVALDLRTGKRQWIRSLIRCTQTDGVRAFADSMPALPNRR